MVIASLPLFDLGLLMFMAVEHTAPIPLDQLQAVLYFYVTILAYSYVLFGVALAIASGLAAMYLRGQLVYDILHTYKETSFERKTVPIDHKKNH